MVIAVEKSSRLISTHPHYKNEGYPFPRECDACGISFVLLSKMEIPSQSIVVTHDLTVLEENCFPRMREVVTVCYQCLPSYVEPLEMLGYDLNDIAVNGIPYVIENTREFAVLKKVKDWGCFQSGSWVFMSFNPPEARALLRVSPMAMIEMSDFPDPCFRLKLEVKKIKRVFFSKLDVTPETSYQEIMAAAKEAEEAIWKKHRKLIESGD